MNITADVAVCAQCNETFALSSIVAAQDTPSKFNVNDPPPGAWFHKDLRGWRIGASTRSMFALLIVPFMCVWSGMSIGGIYGSQISSMEFDVEKSLLGIPFILGTIMLGGIAAMTIAGRIDLSVNDNDGKIFTGVWVFGWTRKFKWSDVERIEQTESSIEYSGGSGYVISLVGKTKKSFGGFLNEERRHFILNGLRILRQRR
ncbi:MAG: hypothetical protein JNK11_04480 [Alphaproteobacteria bacterium]|nr:hypothetical protein [Alphaproteobacteria bacterium]